MNRVLGMLGLAKRAGRTSAGAFACEGMIKTKKAKLVLLARDASENTKKAVRNSCGYYGVRLLELSDMASLGRATGGGDKAVVSVNDENFAKAISDKYILFETEKG